MIQESEASPELPILSTYRPSVETFDEMCDQTGRLRPHWWATMARLDQLGPGELGRSREESVRILRENGVTYNIYDDPLGAWRTWRFDPIPLLVSDKDWRDLEAGLVERAEFWDLVLRDLYGPRRLIETGVLPVPVVDLDPGYLRPCRYLRPTDERMLYLAATDVARRPDGSFCVLDDRTQAPSGSGYALENRILSARLFPELYRDTQVHRLAVFFRSALASLTISAPDDRDEPRIVLLSPGPGNETYFEHSYLAHYLGLTLVIGSDLVVRDRKVWLRTLDGLERIHVIVRRVDDTYCDPLELRADSVLGIPGLLSAIRAGNVLVANPPGTGVCENPALAPFVPAMSRALLGRELRLDGARAYWCGDREDRRYVLDHLDSVVVRPIDDTSRLAPIWPGRLTSAERSALADTIERQGERFAAREIVRRSTTPLWTDTGLEPREMVLRTFLVRSADSYVVMPGGLTRVSPTLASSEISNQDGSVSKDTWVLSETPPRFVTLLPSGSRVPELRRTGGEIASRVAESLYWLGRYAERAEGTARLLRCLVSRLLEARHADNDVCPPDLLRTLTHFTTSYPGFVGNEQILDHPDDELMSLIRDADRGGSLASIVGHLRRTARSARDRLSDDMWRMINSLEEDIESIDPMGDAVEPLANIIVHLSALAGLVADSMTRGPGYWFVDAGRRVERGLGTICLLRSVFFLSVEFVDPLAEALLEVADSVMTYRRRYKSRLNSSAVLDLLLTDRLNPRSVAYQLFRLEDLLRELPSRLDHPPLRVARDVVMRALGSLATTDTDSLGPRPEDSAVGELIDGALVSLSEQIRRISDMISMAYFAQAELPRQLVEIR